MVFNYNIDSMDKSEISLPDERSLLEGILYYISILMKYKYMIIIGTASAMVLVVLFSILSLKMPPDISPLPNQYRAYAVILFQEGGGDGGMGSMLSAFGVESTNASSSSSDVAIQILRSRPFVDKIVKRFNIIEKFEITEKEKSGSREVILNHSEYGFNRDSGALTVAYTSIDPVFAADLVNYEVELLEDWFLNEGLSLRSNELSLMEEKLEELTKEISVIENNIQAYQTQYGVLDIADLATAQTAMLTDLRSRLIQIELEISDYSDYSTIEDPALIILKNQRNNIVTQIRQIEEGYTGSDGRRMPSQVELPQLSLEFSRLAADLALKNQLYLSLSERYEITKLTAAEAGAFSVLEYAEIPEEKESPSRGQLSMMVTFGAFAGLIVLAFMLNMIKNIAGDPEKKKILKGEA